MGPLIPSEGLNLVIGLFIGIAFGFTLEQAGFSTSKKLVGMFYGYDFTVLRVFFTGGLVAMIGVVILAHFGLLDMSLVYINPTYLWSAILGGLIMGLGFVIGGFCPGTGICAAAIGKIDGIIFVIGTIFGVVVFAEGYPLFEGIYWDKYLGNVQMNETLHISQGLFVFLFMAFGAIAFIVTQIIEEKVNGKPNPVLQPKSRYIGFSALIFLLGLSAFILPNPEDYKPAQIKNEIEKGNYQVAYISPDELALRLINNDENIKIYDFRPPEQFAKVSLPNSINLKIVDLYRKGSNKLISGDPQIKKIIIANDEKDAITAEEIIKNKGYKNLYVLQGGMQAFTNDIINFKMPVTMAGISPNLIATYTFRDNASKTIEQLIKDSKKSNVIVKDKKRVLGGC
ncbi:MAG TPA: YeeE/YedE thiosulfate transporter family protein [Bacteroidota bacterium]|nr:YeeE/YedE thiosulfate transporter family protein [Bacteroidota bacterium]